MNLTFYLSKRTAGGFQSEKGTYLKGTSEALQFLQPGRSCGWRSVHTTSKKCCPRRCGFCFSPPMTKANPTPPGSENVRRVLGSSSPAEGTQTLFPPSSPSPHCGTGRCNHLTTKPSSWVSTLLNEPSHRNPLLFTDGTEVSLDTFASLLLHICRRRGVWKCQEHSAPRL